MKVVFLTLLLGLVCVAQEEEAEKSALELSGHWRAVQIASNDLEKISVKALLPYRYTIVVLKECKCIIMIIYVYDWVYAAWRKVTIHVIPIGLNIYTYEYEGTHRLEFIHVSEKALIAINVDETGKKPEQVILFGKENDIDEEVLQKFKDVSLEREIPEENIKDLTEPDECVSLA